MEMVLARRPSANGWTLGVLSIDGADECFTCEDIVRAPGVKVRGETAIPPGRYRIAVTHSPRFGRPLPLLLDVPGFDGVRIHPGNTSKDTEGCILPGQGHNLDGVTASRIAFADLFRRIEAAIGAAQEVWIDVRNP